MDPLNVKLWRDLWLVRGQATAVILVIGAGVATFVMSLCTLETLKRAQATYYESYRFADVFSHVKRAPQILKQRLSEIPGVAQVETRIVENVTLDMPGLNEPATAKLISLPAQPAHGLNRLHLRSGRFVERGRTGEVLVSEAFAQAHHLRPGDHVRAILNGKLSQLRVVGVVLSPEYIYQIREADVLPDDKRFGVMWMDAVELSAAFDLEGAFNDITCTLMPGAVEADVLRRLDRLTEAYGGTGAITRADQRSHKFVTNELQELRGMALVVPTIFLAISAFLLNVVVSRIVDMQREQIAALKAFGYTRREIAWHYLKFVLLVVILGVLAGTIAGAILGQYVTRMYAHFFHFPVFEFYLAPWVVITAAGISASSGLAGTAFSLWRTIWLPPAEAMRPERPATYRPTILERWGAGQTLSEPLKMILRRLERRPYKSLLTIVGIAMSVAVLILGSFMLDAIDYAILAQYQVALREDLNVVLIEPSTSDALHAVERLPGVRYCEPFRAIATTLRHGQYYRRIEILGLSPEAELHRLMDIDCRHVRLPPAGIVLSEKLGEVLHVGVGDQLEVDVLEGKRPKLLLSVVGLVRDFAGMAAYMDRRAMNRLMQESEVVSGAFVAADAAALDELYLELKEAPRVATVISKGAAIRSFRETVAENILRMRSFVVMFAGIIAVGVVYNSSRIALAERSRELATLRVIGFTRREVAFILFGELGVLTMLAIPLGMLLGYLLAAFVIHISYDTELFRMPLVIHRSTYGFSAATVLLASLGSTLLVRHMIDRLDLVAVLKSKE